MNVLRVVVSRDAHLFTFTGHRMRHGMVDQNKTVWSTILFLVLLVLISTSVYFVSI